MNSKEYLKYLIIESINIIDEKDVNIEGVNTKYSKSKEDPEKYYDNMDENIDDTDFDYKEQLKDILLDADAIEIGEELEAITQEIKVDEDQYRYSISKQLDDLLDNF